MSHAATAPAPAPKEESPAADDQEEPKLTVVYPQQEESGESEEGVADKSDKSDGSDESDESDWSDKSDEIKEEAKSPMPATEEQKPTTEEPKPQKPASMVERWKRWLERKVTEVVMDE